MMPMGQGSLVNMMGQRPQSPSMFPQAGMFGGQPPVANPVHPQPIYGGGLQAPNMPTPGMPGMWGGQPPAIPQRPVMPGNNMIGMGGYSNMLRHPSFGLR